MNLKELAICLSEIHANIEREDVDYSNFKSHFGKEFEINFEDIMNFVNIITLFPIITKAYSKSPLNLTKDNYFSFLIQIIEEAQENELIKNNEDSQKLSRLKELLSEMQPLLLENRQDSNEKGESDNQLDEQEGTISFDQFFTEMRVLERINSYFILTLYTYIDVYSMALFKHIISQLDAIEVFDFIRGFNAVIDPLKRINSMFKKINYKDESNLKLLLRKLEKKASWEIYYQESMGLIGIRNIIAHRDPLADFNTLKWKFPESAKRAKIDLIKFRDMMNTDEIPLEILKTLIEPLFKADFESLFLLRNIGLSCYQYLASVDLLIHQWSKERGI